MSGVNESHQHSGLELEGVSTPTSLSYTDLIVELLSSWHPQYNNAPLDEVLFG